MRTLFHTFFKDGMLWELCFSEVDFDLAKGIHQSGQEYSEEELNKYIALNRVKKVMRILDIMKDGGNFYTKETRSYNQKVAY